MINGMDLLGAAICFAILFVVWEAVRRHNKLVDLEEERERRRRHFLHNLVVQDTLDEHIYRQELKQMMGPGLIPTMRRVTASINQVQKAFRGDGNIVIQNEFSKTE